MATQVKRKHSHKRSSSLISDPEVCEEEKRITLPCEVDAEETLQLIKASEDKNQFQIIVDSFEQEPRKISDQDAVYEVDLRASKRNNKHAIFSEYFQIQEVHSLKRQDSTKSTLMSDSLLWEDLHSQPRTNGRLRYHRNMQDKVYTISCQKMNFFHNDQKTPFEGICCNV